jgi:hypothetical protein
VQLDTDDSIAVKIHSILEIFSGFPSSNFKQHIHHFDV